MLITQGQRNDRFAFTGCRNLYDIFGIDNVHVRAGFDRSSEGTGYSAGLGIQEGNFYGSLVMRLSPDGTPEFSMRFDKALGMSKDKFLLEL